MKDECYVYLIVSQAPLPGSAPIRVDGRSKSLCKVGISNTPRSRLAGLQTGSPFQLGLLKTWVFPTRKHAESIEREVHSQMSHERMVGEWFFCDLIGALVTISDIIVIVASQAWGWRPDEIVGHLMKCGDDEETARDTIIANYGEEVFA